MVVGSPEQDLLYNMTLLRADDSAGIDTEYRRPSVAQ
jgi:hypothetical protein